MRGARDRVNSPSPEQPRMGSSVTDSTQIATEGGHVRKRLFVALILLVPTVALLASLGLAAS